MKQLVLEDIVIKQQVSHQVVETYYLDNSFIPSSIGVYPELNYDIKSKKIELNKDYDSSIDNVILNMMINNMIIDKSTKDDFIVDDIESFNDVNKRKLITNLYSKSNKIAIESRIGPATHVIVDNHRNLFLRLELEYNTGNLIPLYHKGLGDYIIVFRQPTKDQSHWGLFHTNSNFAFEEIGNFSNFYNIFKLEGLKQTRTYKLNRILK